MGMRGACGCGIFVFDLVSHVFSHPRTFGSQEEDDDDDDNKEEEEEEK